MKGFLQLTVFSLLLASKSVLAQFPVPAVDLEIWGFEAQTLDSIKVSSNSEGNAKVSYQAIRNLESNEHFILIEECYASEDLAKTRVKSIPKLSKADENGGIYEKGFNIQQCAYIVNAPKRSLTTRLRYSVYPLFYAHMVGRHDFLYYVTAKSGANLRKAADKASESKSTVPFQSVVYIINDSGEWKTAVTVRGSGYIHTDLIQKIYP